jgi:hypothetical protein
VTAVIYAPAPTEKKRLPLWFLLAVFAAVFVGARLVIHPINNIDYIVHVVGLQNFWSGKTPYNMPGYLLPPWSIFFIAPLVNQPLETWLALTVAFLVVGIIDLGTPAGLLLLAHPVFILLLASSNPEWIFLGPGLWLLYRTPRGWGRGLAWLLLTAKPQTTFILLLFDGVQALRSRDWKAIGLAAFVAIITTILFFPPIEGLMKPHDWSASVLSNYGVLGAALATVVILAVRRYRLKDYKTLGLLLAPVWTPYTLQYNYTAVIFTMRSAGWLRNIIFLLASYGLAYLYWRDFHVAEQVGALGMLLLAAILAPAYPTQMPLYTKPELVETAQTNVTGHNANR